ncbi:MAG: M1 family peptidase, partial [Rhodanobacter sp.]
MKRRCPLPLACAVIMLGGASLAAAFAVTADNHARAAFNPQQAFAPFAYPQSASTCRSANGSPGAGYWQNRGDYKITATL